MYKNNVPVCAKLSIFNVCYYLVLFLAYPSTTGYPTENVNPESFFQTASRILDSLNKDVDPCQDFYEFACGGWIKKNPVPEWATSWDQLAKLREQLVMDLRELLEAEDEEGLPTSVVKAKALYRTCINIGKIIDLYLSF